MSTERTEISWKTICRTGLDIRLAALGFALWTDLLTILYAANSTSLFNEVSNSAAFALACMILFVLTQTALLVGIFNPKLISREYIWLLVLLISCISHLELNMYLVQYSKTDSIMGSFYPNHFHLLTGITYITIACVVFKKKTVLVVWFIVLCCTCRRDYGTDVKA